MFKNSRFRTFANWRRSRRDLDKDIDALPIAYPCWHAGKRYFGTRVPATKHVRISGPCVETFPLRQAESPYPSSMLIRPRFHNKITRESRELNTRRSNSASGLRMVLLPQSGSFTRLSCLRRSHLQIGRQKPSETLSLMYVPHSSLSERRAFLTPAADHLQRPAKSDHGGQRPYSNLRRTIRLSADDVETLSRLSAHRLHQEAAHRCLKLYLPQRANNLISHSSRSHRRA